MPILINVLHQSKEEERKALVENLAALVTLLRQHLRKWLPDLLHLIHVFWTSDTQLQSWLLRLISELAGAHVPPTPISADRLCSAQRVPSLDPMLRLCAVSPEGQSLGDAAQSPPVLYVSSVCPWLAVSFSGSGAQSG